MHKSIETKWGYADDTYKDIRVIEFPIVLTKNYYTSFQNIHLCFPLKFKSKADNIINNAINKELHQKVDIDVEIKEVEE